MVVIIATFSHGFGAGSFATSTGQPAFYKYFELDPTSLRTSHQGFKHMETNRKIRYGQYPQLHQCPFFLWLRRRWHPPMLSVGLDWPQRRFCCSCGPVNYWWRPRSRFRRHPNVDCGTLDPRNRARYVPCSRASVSYRGRSTTASGLDRRPYTDWDRLWLHYVSTICL